MSVDGLVRVTGDGVIADFSRAVAAVFGSGGDVDAGILAGRHDESSGERNAGGGVLQEDIRCRRD
jgi:hypothetical protein